MNEYHILRDSLVDGILVSEHTPSLCCKTKAARRPKFWPISLKIIMRGESQDEEFFPNVLARPNLRDLMIPEFFRPLAYDTHSVRR